MLNPFKEVDWNPDRAKLRGFAKTLMVGFPVVGVVLYLIRWLIRGTPALGAPAAIAGCGFGIGLLVYLWPGIGRPFYVAWYGIACLFGLVIGNIIFTLIFVIVVTGLGLLKRLFGK